MSLSDDDPKSPTDKNQEPRESPKGSFFLSSKETDKKIMSQERSSNEEISKSLSRQLLETSLSSVSPMNNVEEPLKSEYGSFWENPNYFESHNTTMNTGNLFTNPSGDMLGGSVDSDPIQMIPTSGDVRPGMEQETSLPGDPTSPTEKNQEPGESPQDSFFLSSEETEKKSETSMSQEMSSDDETLESLRSLFLECDNTGNLLNPFDDILGGNMASQLDPDPMQMMNYSDPLGYQINISPGPFKSIKAMKSAKGDKEEIKMIPTPGFFNRSQCTIKKILTKDDVNAKNCRLKLHKSLFEQYIQKHLPEAKFQELVSTKNGIDVIVYDHDTNTTYEMRLTLRGSFFHLKGSWGTDFIKRKNLREEQEIGLVYDSSDSILHFSVLNLEKEKVPAKGKKL